MEADSYKPHGLRMEEEKFSKEYWSATTKKKNLKWTQRLGIQNKNNQVAIHYTLSNREYFRV